MSTISVQIWSDVVCPWCAIGKRRFDQAKENFLRAHPDVNFEVTYQAFELDPTAPVGVDQSVYDVYVEKFGGDEAARSMIDRVTETAAADGIDFRLDIAQRSNTRLAHRLLVLAEREGKQDALKERLLQAYFTEGKRIGDASTLAELASEIGIDAQQAMDWMSSDSGAAEVASQLSKAAQLGITGVPTFVFADPQTGGPVGIPGAASTEALERVFADLAAAQP